MTEPGSIIPKQHRSQQTLNRIVNSGVALIAQESYAEITISQIAKRAQISVGGFYSRFKNKDALFLALKKKFVEDTFGELDKALGNKNEIGDLRALLNRMVQVNAQLYERYRGVLIEVHLQTRMLGVSDAVKSSVVYNDKVVAKLEELLMLNRNEIAHRHPRVAIRTAIACMSSMLRDAIVFQNFTLYPAPKDHKAIVRQVAQVTYAYLGGTSK